MLESESSALPFGDNPKLTYTGYSILNFLSIEKQKKYNILGVKFFNTYFNIAASIFKCIEAAK